MSVGNASLAARVVAEVQSPAPPSFAGHGWLVAINLGVMTAGCLIALMLLVVLGSDWWKHRHMDRLWSPAWIWRLNGSLFAAGITIRCGAEALTIWGWDPRDPEATATFLLVKRFADPIAVGFGMAGLAVFVLSLPGLLRQLRRQPFPINPWQTWPIVRRMGWLAASSLGAAIAVVSLR